MAPAVVRTIDVVWAVFTVALAFAELGCALLDDRLQTDGGMA